MHCKTALAQAEVEYEEQTTASVYVKFPVKTLPAGLAPKLGNRPLFAVVWTTTPWTLPANLAIAVHPSTRYDIVGVAGERYILAQQRLRNCLRLLAPPAMQHVVA